jgi:hypothetical protein
MPLCERTFLYLYEAEFIQKLVHEKKTSFSDWLPKFWYENYMIQIVHSDPIIFFLKIELAESI